MLCPMKFNMLWDYSPKDNSSVASKYCICEKEKCAWWIEVNENLSSGTLIKLGCAIKLIAEK